MVIFLALMAEAFMGYLLPWGQMSYWGAQVITSLFGAIPVVGDDLALWIRGDFVISDVTLNRFFALHVAAIPLALAGLVFVHIIALHKVGSNNPDGIEIKKGPKGNRWATNKPADGIPFHPYYTVKDIFGVGVFLMFFSLVIFYNPSFFGWFLEPDNFVPADPMKTPIHIAPVWYFTPFYAILRAVPDKFLGVMAMFAAIAMLFALPWLDRSPVKSIRYKGPIFKIALLIFTVSFIGLGYLGSQPPSVIGTLMARIFAGLYFLFFLGMPFYSRLDPTKPVPERVK
jgi:ubiquinol-cytochrome c reductase cytochrome b subunit